MPVRLDHAQRRPRDLRARALGLGPLVRPDLGVFAAGFLLALLLTVNGSGRLWRGRLIASALLLPLVYEAFRMGYFATLGRNTALAKEAGLADWSRLLKDFCSPYLLWIPITLVFGYVGIELQASNRPNRCALVLGSAAVACGLLHALYIVRVGGDFMHGRLLLPSLLGVLLPVGVIVPRFRAHMALAVAVVPWAALCAAALCAAALCAVALRAPYAGHVSTGPVDDERAFYVKVSGRPNPVTLDDYEGFDWARAGRELRTLAGGSRALVLRISVYEVSSLIANGPPGAASRSRVVAGATTIGMLGYAAGPDVRVVDQLGLADPLPPVPAWGRSAIQRAPSSRPAAARSVTSRSRRVSGRATRSTCPPSGSPRASGRPAPYGFRKSLSRRRA